MNKEGVIKKMYRDDFDRFRNFNRRFKGGVQFAREKKHRYKF